MGERNISAQYIDLVRYRAAPVRLSIEVKQVCLFSQQHSVTTSGGEIGVQITMDGICCQGPKMVEVERHTWVSEYLFGKRPVEWSVHLSYVTSNAPTFSFACELRLQRRH